MIHSDLFLSTSISSAISWSPAPQDNMTAWLPSLRISQHRLLLRHNCCVFWRGQSAFKSSTVSSFFQKLLLSCEIVHLLYRENERDTGKSGALCPVLAINTSRWQRWSYVWCYFSVITCRIALHPWGHLTQNCAFRNFCEISGINCVLVEVP